MRNGPNKQYKTDSEKPMLRERTDRSRMKHLRHPTRKQSGLFFQPKSPYGVDCWKKHFTGCMPFTVMTSTVS